MCATLERMKPTRERLLDAFEDILKEEGERAATLDAVAKRAGTSKGGLIYHFPSKEALVDGLCQRLSTLVSQDLVVMRVAPEGAARYYVRTSVFAGSPLDSCLVAVARLQDAKYPQAGHAMRQTGDDWLAVLAEQIGDPTTAMAIKLIGDGLYYEAVFQNWDQHRSPASPPDELLALVDRLVSSASN